MRPFLAWLWLICFAVFALSAYKVVVGAWSQIIPVQIEALRGNVGWLAIMFGALTGCILVGMIWDERIRPDRNGEGSGAEGGQDPIGD